MRSHVESDAALRRLASAVVLGVAAALIVVKLWGWMATGSVALLTSAADAVVDVLAAQSCWRLICPQPLAAVTLGVWVAASGVAIASLLAVMQTWVVHHTGSTAIAADRTHYVADAVLNGAVLAALALTSATGWQRLDPIFALVINGYMIRSARNVAVVASRQLLDHELPDEQRERIKARQSLVPAPAGLRRDPV